MLGAERLFRDLGQTTREEAGSYNVGMGLWWLFCQAECSEFAISLQY